MRKEEALYNTIGDHINNVSKSKMFGVPCLKINKKAFASFYENCMVFKLKAGSDIHSEVLSLDGSELFDPSGKNRPMKEWVQVPYNYKERWKEFAEKALDYVKDKYKASR